MDLIQPKHVYVVVTEDRIMVKRLRGPVKRNEPIELLSDNRYYDPFIQLPQWKTCWSCGMVRALHLHQCIPANTDTRRLSGMREAMRGNAGAQLRSEVMRNILRNVAARYDVKLVGEAS